MIPTPRHEALLVPAAETARRIAALQAALQRADIAVAWVDHAADRLYFTGTVEDGVLLVPAAAEASFIVRKSLERARVERGGVSSDGAAGASSSSGLAVRAWAGRKALAAALDDARGGAGGAGGRVGLAMDVSSAATYALIREERGAPVADIAPMIRGIRAVKSGWELAQLREAGRQALLIYDAAPDLIRAGMTELELSAAIEARLRAAGHGGSVRVRRPGAGIALLSAVSGESALYPTPFDGCVGAEGPSPAAPPGAGWKRIVPGETVMLDMVTWWNGYHADHTRTYYLADGGARGGARGAGGGPHGAIPESARAAHAFCLEALARLKERIRPGARSDEIFRAVHEWAEAAGEPPNFMGHDENRVKFFGHGVGLELDELPVIADRIEIELVAGMVIAMEPKAFLPGIGPVGVEDTVIVTENGPEPLCAANLALTAIG